MLPAVTQAACIGCCTADITYSPGTRIEARQQETEVWYPGTESPTACVDVLLTVMPWFAGVVQRMNSDGTARVKYFGFDVEADVPVEILRPIRTSSSAVPIHELIKGLRCQARYIMDGKFYSARIEEVCAFPFPFIPEHF